MTMSAAPSKRAVAVATACMRADGSADFAFTIVAVTPEEMAEGVHYGLADAKLLENGYEEPFVHFAQGEGPVFLHAAVRQYLGLPPDDNDLNNPLVVEQRR
jgi:hypothetical protein